jgi:hypothetical protein
VKKTYIVEKKVGPEQNMHSTQRHKRRRLPGFRDECFRWDEKKGVEPVRGRVIPNVLGWGGLDG